MSNLFGNLFTRGWEARRGGGFGNLVHLYNAFQSCSNGKSLWSAQKRTHLGYPYIVKPPVVS